LFIAVFVQSNIVLAILGHALHKTGEGRRATLRPGKSRFRNPHL